jgi:hypothetical protein
VRSRIDPRKKENSPKNNRIVNNKLEYTVTMVAGI